MRLITRMFAAALVCLSVIPTLAQSGSADEFKKLQGAGVVLGGEHDGKPLDGVKGGVLTITTEQFALHTASGRDLKGQLKINASATPPTLDFVHDNGTLWEGIYSLDGETFKLNYIEAKDKRPTLFVTGKGTEASIIVMAKKP
jgi:uncharacterized protein (TIGR03067 family)